MAKFHRFALLMTSSGLIEVLAGWVTTEVGCQPWAITGLLSTADSAATLEAPAVAASLIAFVLVYFAVCGTGIGYIIKLMAKPPQAHEPDPPNIPARSAGITPAQAIRTEPNPTASGATTRQSL